MTGNGLYSLCLEEDCRTLYMSEDVCQIKARTPLDPPRMRDDYTEENSQGAVMLIRL